MMNDFEKFVNENNENKQSTEVNLTPEQLTAIKTLSKSIGIPFEDTVMMLIELQLSDIGGAFINQFVQAQAVKN